MTGTSLVEPVWCDLCQVEHPMPAGECFRLLGAERQARIDQVQLDWLKARARARCLHVGCGEKYWAGMVNIDPNPDRPQVDHRYDVHELPAEWSGTFDSVISCHVLPALKDPVRAMREMARVLCPGGVMAHVVPDNSYAPQRHNAHHPWDYQHHNWFSPEQFQSEVLALVRDVLDVDVCAHFDGFRFSFCVVCRRR